MKILVISCDKYQDIFEPFHYCMEKYWPNHPEIIYVTETIKNKFYRTESLDAEWTERVKHAVELIDDDYILMMCDDVFIRDYVNKDRIDYLLSAAKLLKDFCAMSFISGVKPRPDLKVNQIEGLIDIGHVVNDRYHNSVNCTLWKKDMLIKCLTGLPINVDEFEQDKTRFNGEYYTSLNQNWPIKWGRENYRVCVALVRGKWTKECIQFFNSENYYIDFEKRGIVEGDLF